MSRDFITALIERYRAHECLWNVTSPDYCNRNLKNAAYDDLVGLCQSFSQNLNRGGVQIKLQNLRTTFRKELKKVEDSRRNGASEEDIYIPRLWYYDLLLFTTGESVPEKLEMFPSTDSSTTDCSMNSLFTQNNEKGPSAKRKRQEEDFLETCSKSINHLQQVGKRPVDEYEATGIVWAAKLRKMGEVQRMLAEGLVNNILERGYFQELTRQTQITNNAYNYVHDTQ